MRCFLSTSSKSSYAITEAVRAADVEVVSAKDLGTDWLTQAVADIDFVCAALDRHTLESSPAALYLEIGAALGRNLPLLIITDSRKSLPLPLAGIQSVEADFSNTQAITLHVRQFAESLHSRRTNPLTDSPPRHNPPLDQVKEYLTNLRPVTTAHSQGGLVVASGYQFEQAIRLIFASSGSDTSDVAESESPDSGFDFATWVDGASEILGGPILVECKVANTVSPGSLSRAAQRLTDVLNVRSLYFGLIVYHSIGHPERRVRYNTPYPVGVIAALDLVEQASSGSLSRTLVKLRNSQMHQTGLA